MTQPPSTFEIERDEAALKEIRRLDSVFGDADINPKCIIQFGTFMANWAADYFRSKLQDQAEVIGQLKENVEEMQEHVEMSNYTTKNMHSKISHLEKQLEESRRVIEKLEKTVISCATHKNSAQEVAKLGLRELELWRNKK